jgi:diaminohydroxyphosphoribosylaminopyrimidine deaminase/5-amino-6-(5-phosphoribosylamino)uracil reductase
MARALFHAARGEGRTSPNPLVGAVVVSQDGIVLGQGHHERAGGAHAEVRALAEAGGRARGATLYCTLEPCAHHGRTGPCAARIVDAGIRRVVAAVQDPNPLVNGRGLAFLQSHGVDVRLGPGAAQSIALNQPFFTLIREGRPFVTLKAATSADGFIAGSAGGRTLLTSAPANRHAHRRRAAFDAIAVGVGTVIADDPLLTVRGVYRERPLTRVIFDRSLRTPPDARVLSTLASGPVMIVTTERAAANRDVRHRLEARGAEVLSAGTTSIKGALRLLAGREIASLLLEGGAAIHAAAWAEEVVDFVRLYVSPRNLNAGVRLLSDPSFSTATLADRRVDIIGPDVLIEGYVHRAR